MKKNINSFASSTEELTRNANIALEALVQINNSLSTDEDTFTVSIPEYDEDSGKSQLKTFNIPSYNYVLSKIGNTDNTLQALTSGVGNVKMNDGSYREVTTNTIAKAPNNIYGIQSPKIFKSTSNWFFEDLLFPKLVIPFDLKNKIDDSSDRILSKRIIIDNEMDSNIAWFKNNLVNNDLSYTDVINLLTIDGIKYWEDEQIVNLPLKKNTYIGTFPISKTSIIDGKKWYFLDNIYYSKNIEGDIVNNIELTVGDKLSFNNTSYIISDMVNVENRICVENLIGFDLPIPTSYFEYYCEPFREKIVEIGIGYNELTVLFFKGVNEDYNILSDNWSRGVVFDTNDLIYEGTNISMMEFYNKYVIDYGKQLEGQAKERFIPAFFGEIPNTPNLNSEDFRVVQVNNHINSSISTQNVLNTQKQIIETKSQIDSYKSTIAKQKQDLISQSDESERKTISESIRSYTNKLETLSTEYSSLVKTLSAMAYSNDAVEFKPKYRIRGFFPVPEYKISNNITEEIIQFEIAYRYLRLDNTYNPLNTFSFTDTDGIQKTGIFSDWNYEFGLSKSKIYDSNLGEYIWVNENVSDGEEVNINQIDLAIQKGERVEIKVRSISEAGWPSNPLKSEWSEPVIINFPSNIENSSMLDDILSQAVVDETNLQLQETMSAAGVYVHLDDTVQSSNTANGIAYKHMANNIGVNVKHKDSISSVSEIRTISLEDVISDILSSNTFIDLTIPDNNNSYSTNSYQLSKVLSVIINKLNITSDDLQ